MTWYEADVTVVFRGVKIQAPDDKIAKMRVGATVSDWAEPNVPLEIDTAEVRVGDMKPIGNDEKWFGPYTRDIAYNLAELFYYADDDDYGDFEDWDEGISRIENEISTVAGVRRMQAYLENAIDQDDFSSSDMDAAREYISELDRLLYYDRDMPSSDFGKSRSVGSKATVRRAAPKSGKTVRSKAPPKKLASKSVPAKPKSKAPAKKAPAKKPATGRH